MSGDRHRHEELRYVGRVGELAWLARILDEALSGLPRIAVVSGEPGIGKSRLLREFIGRAQESGAVAATGRAYEGQAVPYHPWSELLRGLTIQIPDLETEVLFGRREDGAFAGQRTIYESQGGRSELYTGVSDLIFEITKENRLLLVLDDLQWADSPSVELLSHVVFSLTEWAAYRDVGLMILLATRPLQPSGSMGKALSRIEREDCADSIEIGAWICRRSGRCSSPWRSRAHRTSSPGWSTK